MENKEAYGKSKSFIKNERRSFKGRKFSSGKSGNKGPKSSFKRRKLEVGSIYRDRELGEGTVTAITEETIAVRFGESEKIFPRRKREERKKDSRISEKRVFEKREYAKDDRNPVFTFDTTEDRNKESESDVKRSPVKVGLHVNDDVLGPGVVGRITERGTYVTYERTGEFVLYPLGLPLKLIKSAFPEEDVKEKRAKRQRPLREARTYKVSPKVKKEEKKEVLQGEKPSRGRKETGNIHYFELAECTRVLNKIFGTGVIKEIGQGTLLVDFEGEVRQFSYPEAFARGELDVIRE
ncbi:MAG: hypothetical protein E6330_04900 [Dialister sp.]|nr:hypothetical protein [Dialister sp.]